MLSRLAPAALLLAGVASVSASDSISLQPVMIVTATRIARTVDETLAPVTVITREDIERSQAQSVPDLLRGLPGVSIANNGGAGKATSVFLRGANSDHVLVLIDGVKVGSGTTGTAAFQDLPVELIERIEIVRGPRSSLYGSEAIGGVIQIFTRKGGGPLKPSLSIGAGSEGTRQASATLSGGAGTNGWFNVGLSGFDTNGFNACRGRPSPGGAGCFTNEPDNDGYRNLSGSLRGGWRFENGAEAEFNWLRAQGRNEFDGTTVNDSKSVQEVLGARLRFNPLARWRMSLSAGQSRDDSDNFKNWVFKSRFDTRRDTFSWQNDVLLGAAGTVVAGVDWLNDRIDSTTAYAVTSRRNTGAFAQYLADVGRHALQFSLRRDDNQQFGGHTTGGAAWGYDISKGLRATLSYGTAFKAPTFNQLYFPGFGNAALRPEKSRSVEAGLAGTLASTRWSLNAFETRVTDLIGFDATFTPVNIDSARLRGVEAVASARVSEWDVRGNLTLLDPRNEAAGANNGKVLPRRAEQALAVHADRGFGAWSVGGSLRAEGRRYDDLANTVKLGGYATLDLRAEYRVAKDWRLQAKLENILDKQYDTAFLFNQPGRRVFVTLRYQP